MDETREKQQLEYASPELNRRTGRPLWFTCLLLLFGLPSLWLLFVMARVAWFYLWH